jgi:DedD protein
MAKQTTEEEFNLRRQTRRRLIGAVALVLFVVILLPVVFDSDPAPAAGNDIELRIPDKDDAGEFQPKIDLPELDRMAAADAAAASAVASAVASAPVAAVAPPAAKPAATAQPVNKPKAEAQPKVESKPAARVQTIPKSGWVVQVGAFANADTARNLQAKLSKQGYHAYTEKMGSVVRVRVGSYPTQEAAEKAKGKLEVQGMASNVVNLE